MTELLNKNFIDFTGGLNFTDSELNMRENYFVEARNVELVYDSTIKKRNGFRLVKSLTDVLATDEAINEIFYFQLHVIICTDKGRVIALDDQNVVEVIWDTSIAEANKTTIWNRPEERVFGTTANNLFVLSNGYDKPLQVNLYPTSETESKCHYLLDPATGSNAKIPVIYQCRMVNHYLCATVLGSNKVYISAKDQPGLWSDDNQTAESTEQGALVQDISNIVGIPNQNIVDLATYKNLLCVITDYHIILLELDNYTESTVWDETVQGNVTKRNHTPQVNMVVDNAGCATIGSVQSTMKTLVFLSVNGVNNIERNAVSQNFVPVSLSEKILPYIKSKLTDQVLEEGVHSFVDRQKYMYGIKFGDDEVLCMSFHPNISDPCYWVWDQITYKSFTNNVHGRVLAADSYGIYIYADDAEGYCEDDVIIKGESGFTAKSNTFLMDVETPWLHFGKPNNVKTMDYINVVTDGTAKFTTYATCDMVDDWQLTIDMVGGSLDGYGSGDNPWYGGGLRSGTEELCDFPQVFMYTKFRFTSTDNRPLRIIRYGSFYKLGGIRR